MDSIGISFLYQFALGQYDFANPGANVLSVTTQATGDHDKKNLTTAPLRETYRTATASGWQEIIMEANDLNDAPDVIAILNHNLTEIANVQVQFSTTADFSTVAATLTIPWREKHMVLLQDVGQAFRYYRFRILDPTNPCEYLEIGRIIAGKAFTFSQNEDVTDNFTLGWTDKAAKMDTEGFFRASNERVKIERLNVTFDKLWTTKTAEEPTRNVNYLGLMALLKEVGETMPFLTIFDPSDADFLIMWGQVDSLPTRSFGVNRYTSLSLAIQEVY